MSRKGFSWMAIDKEVDLGDGGDVGVKRSEDGEQGQRFRLDAGGMRGGEGCAEVDYGEGSWIRVGVFDAARIWRSGGFRDGH